MKKMAQCLNIFVFLDKSSQSGHLVKGREEKEQEDWRHEGLW
jgi:hypothetical protein